MYKTERNEAIELFYRSEMGKTEKNESRNDVNLSKLQVNKQVRWGN